MSAAAADVSPRQGRLPMAFAAVLLLLCALGPMLANDAPLAARADGVWSFPAVAETLGAPPPPPPPGGWRQWAAAQGQAEGALLLWPIWNCSPLATDLDAVRAGPSLAHPLGADDTGRDVLARLVRGARSTVGCGLLGVALAAVVGTALGAFAGLLRGAADFVVQRLIEAFLCVPTLALLLLVAAFFGDAPAGVVAAFALAMWPSFARIVRGELLALREQPWVETARALGSSEFRIFVRHILPQLRGQIAVTAAFCMAAAIVAESTLSFLGIGPGVQSGSWGGVLAQGKDAAHLGAWHLWAFPGALIAAAVVCCHALADRLRPR